MEEANTKYYGVLREDSIKSRQDFTFFELSLKPEGPDSCIGNYKDALKEKLSVKLDYEKPQSPEDRREFRFIVISGLETLHFKGYLNYESASENLYAGKWFSNSKRQGSFVVSDFQNSPDLAKALLDCEKELLR